MDWVPSDPDAGLVADDVAWAVNHIHDMCEPIDLEPQRRLTQHDDNDENIGNFRAPRRFESAKCQT